MSFRYPAGLITASSPVNANYPSGVWTPRQALPYLQNNVWGQDPFFDQTTLLLHGDGTNGAQNNTFLDSSSNNFTITRNGNTTQGTFTPFSLAAGEWSNYFDGSGDFLTFDGSSSCAFGTGNFTVEMFVFMSATPAATMQLIDARASGSTVPWTTAINTSSQPSFYDGTNSHTSSIALNINSWNHVAFVRSSGTLNIYVNGISGFSGSVGVNITSAGSSARIGANLANTTYFLGYLSNIRINKGTAVYTAAFTPPTAPLTAITNTSLLTCQSNRFVDNSTNNFAITRNGDVRVTPFSPFQPLLAYSPGVTGGSGYFDGNGDFLSLASQSALALGTGDFQISYWIYPTAFSSNEAHIMWVTSGDYPALFSNASGNIVLDRYASGTLATTTNAMTLNAWNYIVCSRVGTTLKIWINGSEGASITNSTNFGQSAIQIGNNNFTAYLDGYMSDMRVVKGSGVTSVTVPTSPATAIANTQLLCNFTNAGILDNTAKNVLETVGNAQIETAVVKYGTGSMEFDGDDFLKIPSSPLVEINGSDFTMEFWIRFNSVSGDAALISKYGNSAENLGGQGYVLQWVQSTAVLRLVLGNNPGGADQLYTWSWSPSINVWYHVAVTRSVTSGRAFVDGTQIGSTLTLITNDVVSPNALQIGKTHTVSQYLNGFIDDLRITKGIARYTANFVPPIARFPNQ